MAIKYKILLDENEFGNQLIGFNFHLVHFHTVQRQVTPNGYHNSSRDINSPSHNDSDYKYGRFDASALHIAHALKQTEIQKAYNKRREKPIDYYLVSINTNINFVQIFRENDLVWVQVVGGVPMN